MSPEQQSDHETPRQRRERIFVAQRSRRWRVLIAAGLGVIVLAGGALWAFHRSSPRATVVAEVPLIHADEQPTRKKPADPGGMAVPDQDSIVLNRSEPKVEQLLPPPETPLPRPAPAEPPPAAAPQAENAPPGAAPTPPPAAEPTPAPSPPEPAAAAPPSPPPAPAAPQRAARAAAPPPPAPSSGKGYRLQLGSVRTPESAKQEWDRLQRQNTDVLGKLGYSVVRVDLAGRGIFYRIQAGPLPDSAAAERACNELKRRGEGCILVKP